MRLLLASGRAGGELLPADLASRGVQFLSKPYRIESLIQQVGLLIGHPKVPLRVVS